MASGAGARLLALPPSVAVDRSIAALADVREYVDPDGVWLPGPGREPRAVARARQVFDEPIVHPPLGDASGLLQRHDLGDVSILTAGRASVLPEAAGSLSSALADAGPVALVCDDVTTSVRLTSLETTLECAPELVAALPADGTRVTVLSGGLPADYDAIWHLESATGDPIGVSRAPAVECPGPDDRGSLDAEALDSERGPTDDRVVSVRVHGTGPVEGYGDARTLSTLSLAADGTVAAETLDADAFGLEAVSGVGPKTAARLERRGIETRAELLEAPVDDLETLPGLGRASAERIRQQANALETGAAVRLTDESLPGENWHTPPLCFDIETDGLSPTICWQLGVYDPETDEYRAFVERSDPTDPRPVLAAFADWLLGVHPDRALLTWNGWGFDYRHLGAFLSRYLPGYAEEWESVPKFDLYLWAVTNEHALLPGRTNRLADVASALGYEGAQTGLDGARTAAAYQRFIRTGEELEWDRFEAYCEDDCRALWHVYEQLREAPRASFGERDSSASGQTGLGDF